MNASINLINLLNDLERLLVEHRAKLWSVLRPGLPFDADSDWWAEWSELVMALEFLAAANREADKFAGQGKRNRKLTADVIARIKDMHQSGTAIRRIAIELKLSRASVYKALEKS